MASSSTRYQQLDEPTSSSNKRGRKHAVGDFDVSLPFTYSRSLSGFYLTSRTAVMALVVSHAAMFTFTDPATGAIKFSS